MRTPNTKLSPAKLLWLIAAANLLCSAGFASAAIFRPAGLHDWRAALPSRLPWLLMIVLGYAFSLVAERLLGKGIQRQRWTDHQLRPLRGFLRSRIPFVLLWSLFVAAMLTIVLDRSTHTNELFWTFLGPSFSLMRVWRILSPLDSAPTASITLSLSSAPPLRSEH